MSAPTITFEVEVALTGEVSRYYPATYTDPADGGEVYDLDITDLGAVSLVRPPVAERGSHRLIWKTTSLLDGVDLKSPAIQRLFTNILEAHRRDAEQAIVDDQMERAA